MTNIEKLALDICRLNHRDKIMQTLPLFLTKRDNDTDKEDKA